MANDKELSKQELIELFIEYFNRNRELFPEITEEIARDKLNTEIKEVKYLETIQIGGSWNPRTRILEIGSAGDFETSVIHELIHVLSTSINKELGIEKVGLNLEFTKSKKQIGLGINEGITETIAEKTTGNENDGYQIEKHSANMLFALVGFENVMRHYYDNQFVNDNINITEDFEMSDFFENDISSKYKKPEQQKEVRSLINRMSRIVDEITNLNMLNAQGKPEWTEKHREYEAILGEIFSFLIKSQELAGKIETIKNFDFPNDVAGMVNVSDNIKNMLLGVMQEISDNQELNETQKIEYLKTLYDTGLINENIEMWLVNTAFGRTGSISERVDFIKEFIGSSGQNGENIINNCFERVWEELVSQGRFSREDTAKKDVLKGNLHSLEDIGNIEQIIDGLTYKKIGPFYKLQYNGELDFELTDREFDDTGIMSGMNITRTVDGDGNEQYKGPLSFKRQILPAVQEITTQDKPYKVSYIKVVRRKKVVIVNFTDENEKQATIFSKNYLLGENNELTEIPENETEEQFANEIQKEDKDETRARPTNEQLEASLGQDRMTVGIINAAAMGLALSQTGEKQI